MKWLYGYSMGAIWVPCSVRPAAPCLAHQLWTLSTVCTIDAGIRTSFSFENIEGKCKDGQRIWSYLQQDCLLLCCFCKVLVFTLRWAGSELRVVDSCCFQISRPPWSRRSSMINHLFCKFVFLTIRKRASCSITEGRFSTSLTSSVIWLSLPASYGTNILATYLRKPSRYFMSVGFGETLDSSEVSIIS